MNRGPLVLRNRNFGLIWLGQVFSQGGSRMYQIAVLWWITQHRPNLAGPAIGCFLLVAAIPSVAFFRRIGRLIEQTPSRMVLIRSDTAACLITLLIAIAALVSAVSLPLLYLTAFALALCQAFIDPTLPKAVPELVEAVDIEAGIAFETSTQALANFAGAVAGALFINWLGLSGVIFLNALSYAISAGAASLARFNFAISPNRVSNIETGWKIFDSMPLIRKLLIGFGAINFFVTPTFLVLPLFTSQTLHANAATLAALEAVLWVGLIFGAFTASFIRLKVIHLGIACMLMSGVLLFAEGFVTSIIPASAILGLVGVSIGLTNVKFVTFYQATVPPDLKGRFFAIVQAMISATFPAAYFSFGILAGILKPEWLWMLQGTGIFAISFYFVKIKNADQ